MMDRDPYEDEGLRLKALANQLERQNVKAESDDEKICLIEAIASYLCIEHFRITWKYEYLRNMINTSQINLDTIIMKKKITNENNESEEIEWTFWRECFYTGILKQKKYEEFFKAIDQLIPCEDINKLVISKVFAQENKKEFDLRPADSVALLDYLDIDEE